MVERLLVATIDRTSVGGLDEHEHAIFTERFTALRKELGMPQRAPMKRRKKKAHRENGADKPVGNGATT